MIERMYIKDNQVFQDDEAMGEAKGEAKVRSSSSCLVVTSRERKHFLPVFRPERDYRSAVASHQNKFKNIWKNWEK